MPSSVETKWTELCESRTVKCSRTSEWWTRLLKHYSEPQRAYHNLVHIRELLDLSETVGPYFPEIVQLAIFFHDVIYDPKSSTNEDDSIILFQEFAKDTVLSQEEIDTISKYIAATKNHMEHPSDFATDLQLFLDYDLAILGSDRQRYEQYSEQVRQEYSHYPLKEFSAKRLAFLEKLSATPSLYYVLKDRFEQKAKENIQWEISKLKDQLNSS